MTRIYKRYGKNITDVKFDFQEAYPEKTILKIKVDKSYQPSLSPTKKRLRKRYLIKVKDKEGL